MFDSYTCNDRNSPRKQLFFSFKHSFGNSNFPMQAVPSKAAIW